MTSEARGSQVLTASESGSFVVASNLSEGHARLAAALDLLGYDNQGAWDRMELLTAVRKFGIAAQDAALENACDRMLADLDEVAFGAAWQGMSQVQLFPRDDGATDKPGR